YFGVLRLRTYPDSFTGSLTSCLVWHTNTRKLSKDYRVEYFWNHNPPIIHYTRLTVHTGITTKSGLEYANACFFYAYCITSYIIFTISASWNFWSTDHSQGSPIYLDLSDSNLEYPGILRLCP